MSVLALVFAWLPRDTFRLDRAVLNWTWLAVALALLAALILAQIRAIVAGSGARSALWLPVLVFMSVVVFATAYLALAQRPGEFSGLRTRVDALYFTVVTMATVGYGDIVPVGQSARLLVVAQIVYGIVFVGAAATALGQHVRGRMGERARPPR